MSLYHACFCDFRFAAALKDLKLWVMNVVPIDSPDTLPIIYERGLIGIYHDWCESFSSYPRSYDLLHADHLFSDLKNRFVCYFEFKWLVLLVLCFQKKVYRRKIRFCKKNNRNENL